MTMKKKKKKKKRRKKKKTLLVFSLIKPRWNNEVILRNFELFSCGDILVHYTSNLFLKRSAPSSYEIRYEFMGAFAKLWKGTINFVTSVCLSDCLWLCVYPSAWNISAQTGRSFTKFDTWEFRGNLLRKFNFHQDWYHEDIRTCVVISLSVFLRMRNVSERKLWRTSKHKYNNYFPKIPPSMR
jgi:hypothetical protein